MELVRIILVGLITAVSVLVLREYKQDMAVLVGIVGGLIMLGMVITALAEVVEVFDAIANQAGLSQNLMALIIKIIGVGYITEFSAEICEDAGVKSVASKIQLSGKIIILILALPIIRSLLEIVVSLTP